MAEHRAVSLHFVDGFSDRDAFEAQCGGYRSHVFVETPDGRFYPVLFYDAVRLQQDLEVEAKHGHPFIADPGMIVLPKVTHEAMQRAVERLVSEGFFDHLTPMAEEDLRSGELHGWPPRIPAAEQSEASPDGVLPRRSDVLATGRLGSAAGSGRRRAKASK